MANQVKQRLLLSAAAAAVSFTLAVTPAAGRQTKHLPDYANLMVEHAELVLGPEGVSDSLYLTIYNGTGRDVAIADIAVAGYADATLVRRTNGFRGSEEVTLSDAFLVIPRKAELDMGKDTLFISLKRNARLPRSVMMTITFDDGTSTTVLPRILESGNDETSHHHGALELERARKKS